MNTSHFNMKYELSVVNGNKTIGAQASPVQLRTNPIARVLIMKFKIQFRI